jgi:hypothetical protein
MFTGVGNCPYTSVEWNRDRSSLTGFFSLDRSLEVNLLVISSKKEQRFDRVWLRVHIQKKKKKVPENGLV